MEIRLAHDTGGQTDQCHPFMVGGQADQGHPINPETRIPNPETPSNSVAAKRESAMSLNKKQKKQIEVHRQKITKLRQLLSGAKQQMDDPAEVPRLEKEIAEHEASIEKLKSED